MAIETIFSTAIGFIVGAIISALSDHFIKDPIRKRIKRIEKKALKQKK
jgi:peptidoglycan/LPS O-acetylase OafA/YrhL